MLLPLVLVAEWAGSASAHNDHRMISYRFVRRGSSSRGRRTGLLPLGSERINCGAKLHRLSPFVPENRLSGSTPFDYTPFYAFRLASFTQRPQFPWNAVGCKIAIDCRPVKRPLAKKMIERLFECKSKRLKHAVGIEIRRTEWHCVKCVGDPVFGYQ